MLKVRSVRIIFSNKFFVAVLLFLCFFLIYRFSSESGGSPYDYYSRLAQSLIKGKLYLTNPPPWLNEVVPVGNKNYIVYPPMPALIMAPLTLIFGGVNQTFFSNIIGAASAVILFFITHKKLGSVKKSVFISVAFGIGTIYWYLSATGSVWYLAQVVGVFFTFLFILEGISKKRPYVLGIMLGAAFLSRIQLILLFPLFFYFYERVNLKIIINIALGLLPFILFYGVYNYLRFGSPTQTGYSLIPGVLEEPWYQHGLFSLRNIPRHLEIFFLKIPNYKPNFPYLTPSWGGLAFWITTPLLLLSFKTLLFARKNLFIFLSIFFVAIINFSYGSTGFTQFGYRYAVDFYPLIFLLLINYFSKKNINLLHLTLFTVGVVVNTWGVFFINIFNWVSY